MLPLALVLAFLLIPVVEIVLLVQVGEVIGVWPTLALLAAETALGAWIVRREGRRAWHVLQDTLRRGTVPDRELGDAALVMAGGVLLLIPGLITDVLGLLFVLPFTRPLVRRAGSRYAARRMRLAGDRASMTFPSAPGGRGGPGFGPLGGFGPFDPDGEARDPGTPRGPVVRGEVVEEDDHPSRT
ncbi:FxsA family protein [Actinomadura verrucosospora]|uniref:FxsA cytoplasmic membrane protein n=1 Tax=Actinomadura verrucosospora TaxID=46165 RepID=A0A7D3ZH30_ACTVE|nr:FxsA family protein [Actinomadura verrucosospora]QKG19321.1 FxsA cytoplasmic membrane protein [Actinomadura verrucosospora]